jgi:hypothetical protein
MARRPPGGLGILGADDLPTTHQMATDEARLDITLLAMCGATYILLSYYSREGSSYIIINHDVLPGCHGLFFLSFNLCTRRMFLDA